MSDSNLHSKPAQGMTWPHATAITASLSRAKLGVAPYLEDHAIATAFRERHNEEPGYAWGLLAELFNIHLKPSDALNPYGPMWEGNGKRSMVPTDISDGDLDALSATLEDVADPEYRARIGDLLWLRRKDAVAARVAVAAYLESGRRVEDPVHWVTSMQRYERGLRLARSLGRGEALFDEIANYLIERVRFYNGSDESWLSHRALSLLEEFRAGDPEELGLIAGKAAENALRNGDQRKAREHYELRAKFLRRAGHTEEVTDALRAAAETFASEAEQREVGNSFMVAHKFWGDAIQAYRRIPNSGERIAELHRRMSLAGEKMQSEMKTFKQEIDLTDRVNAAESAVEGLSLNDALCTFVILSPLIDPATFRKEVEDAIKENPIHALIQADVFDGAGRKVDVRPSTMTDDPAEYDRAIRGLMNWYAQPYRTEVAMGTLAAAMRKILTNHTVNNEVIESLIQGSGFIPPDRLSIYVRAVRLGFEWDFSTALHVLIPQVENSLRHLLVEAGIIVTTIDAVGIEETWPLGRILNESRLAEVLGDGLLYELRSLLLGQPGLNIRNLVAHGLMSDTTLNGPNALYLWWVFLRLILFPTPIFREFVDRSKARNKPGEP